MLAIQHTGSKAKRAEAYRDLLKVAKKTVGYAERAIEHLEGHTGAQKLADDSLLKRAHDYLCVVASYLLWRVGGMA